MNENTIIGQYRIIEPLGKGGIGEVYLAEDTRLKRQVALKVLPERLRNNAERLKRFRREAEAAASLKHNNIATIYALEEMDGPDGNLMFITMEYVEGSSLKDLIPDDGTDLDTFFNIFIPLADALSHAHSQGRIHRDLKPGNIMVTEDGTSKILDFGLARIIDPDPVQVYSESETEPEIGPDDETRTMDEEEQRKAAEAAKKAVPSLTRGGQLIGTPQYMSPEQAEREDTDARTDIFSFGVVMYEALTGQRPFEGKTLESIIGKIIEAQPTPVTELKPITPYSLWMVIRTCLRKDREARTQNARRLLADLKDIQQEVQTGTVLVDASTIPEPESVPEPPPEPEPVPFWRQPMAIASVVVTLGIGILGTWFMKPEPERPIRRFQLHPEVTDNQFGGPAISPDGTMVVYEQNRRLWIRDLRHLEPHELPNTENGQRPFWSPNSDAVGYFEESGEWTLRTVSLQGGPSTPVCTLPGDPNYPRGGAWTRNGDIVFSVTTGGDINTAGVLYTVPAPGGTPQVYLPPDTGQAPLGRIYPHVLPDGESLIYALTTADRVGTIVMHSGDTETTLVRQPADVLAFPVYASSGHIVYQRGFNSARIPSSIWAVPVDLSNRTAGQPVLVVDGGSIPGVSRDGTLLYRKTGVANITRQLVWVNRKGEIARKFDQPQLDMVDPALSPDGRHVAVSALEKGNRDIWIHDMELGNKVKVTSESGNMSPYWSPSGDTQVFASMRSGNGDLYLRAADGSGTAQLLISGPDYYMPSHWTPDGQYLLYSTPFNRVERMWYMPMTGERIPVQFNESGTELRVSPDGRYVAFESYASGQRDIYVTQFPSGQGKWKISVNGGQAPRWSGAGDEIFYIYSDSDGTETLMAAPVSTSPSFQHLRPQPLFSGISLYDFADGNPLYDAAPNGQRFVVAQTVEVEDALPPVLMIIENWIKQFESEQ